MIFIPGVMKLLPPDMKSRNNFMTGECGFHDGGKVDFPDDSRDVTLEVGLDCAGKIKEVEERPLSIHET